MERARMESAADLATSIGKQVGRFVADAETIYSYEGTREINTLIVGRALTGIGAFV
jgi:alkylation response protein AidB-like acyl-CoA dehydrogenase